MKLRSHLRLLLAAAMAFVMAGCGGGGGSDTNPNPAPFAASGPQASVRFDPSTSDVPLPMDIARNQQTGFNAITGTGEPFDSINSLQGWSTSGPILINFSAGVDAASVNAGSIILLDTVAGAPVPVFFQQLAFNGQSTVKMYPVRPLTPFRRYMVIVTNKVSSGGQPIVSSRVAGLLKFGGSLVDANGNSTVSSLTNAQAAALEPLRAAWQAIWPVAETVTGQPRGDIPFAWTFTTQPLFQTLPELHTRSEANTPVPTVTGAFVGAAQVDFFFANVIGNAAIPHNAITAVYVGSIPVPSYISDPLNGPFQGTPANPTQLGTINIPFIAYRGASTAAGTMIYGHGITRSMLDSTAIANGACANGLGVIAINFVLHGNATFDQTFGLTTRVLPGQPSGTGFINLSNPRMSRDNIRQTTSDLMNLQRMIELGNTNFVGNGAEFSTANQVYVGQSLGGIIGTVFTAVEPDVRLGVLNVPGGRLAKLLLDSPTFGPVITAGLQAAGVTPGTYRFEQVVWILQTVVDDADAFNYGAHVLAGTLKGNVATNVLVQEMLGDLVVPNTATDDLARSIAGTGAAFRLVLRTNAAENQNTAGLTTVAGPTTGAGLFQYIGGQHGFLLDPTQGPTTAAQTQVFTYLLTGIGGGIANATIIVPAGQRAGDALYSLPFDLNVDTLFQF